MTKIKEFSRQNLKEVRRAIDAALKIVGDEMGFSIELGNNISFSPTSFNGKITAAITANGESPRIAAYRENLIRYSSLTDVKEEHIGATIKISKGRLGKLIGYSPKSTKYPFIVELPDGNLIKCMEGHIKRELGISKPMGGLTRVPAPTGFNKKSDGKGGLVVTPTFDAPKKPLTVNEQVILHYIHAVLVETGRKSCTMNELLTMVQRHKQFEDASAMVYAGNLKKKGYITRDNKKNIFIA